MVLMRIYWTTINVYITNLIIIVNFNVYLVLLPLCLIGVPYFKQFRVVVFFEIWKYLNIKR